MRQNSKNLRDIFPDSVNACAALYIWSFSPSSSATARKLNEPQHLHTVIQFRLPFSHWARGGGFGSIPYRCGLRKLNAKTPAFFQFPLTIIHKPRTLFFYSGSDLKVGSLTSQSGSPTNFYLLSRPYGVRKNTVHSYDGRFSQRCTETYTPVLRRL